MRVRVAQWALRRSASWTPAAVSETKPSNWRYLPCCHSRSPLNLIEQLALLQAELEALKKELTEAYTKISAMDGAVVEASGHSDRAAGLEEKVAELQTQLIDWKAKYDALNAEIDPMRQERDELKRKNAEMAKEIARLYEEASTSKSIYEQIEIKKATSPGGILSP